MPETLTPEQEQATERTILLGIFYSAGIIISTAAVVDLIVSDDSMGEASSKTVFGIAVCGMTEIIRRRTRPSQTATDSIDRA